jgi:hypothetical protein
MKTNNIVTRINEVAQGMIAQGVEATKAFELATQIVLAEQPKAEAPVTGTGKAAPREQNTKATQPKAEPKPIEWAIDGKTVKADRRMSKALYARNKAIAIEDGATLTEGEKVFTAVFTSKAKAKAFVDKAVCILSAEEYEASRNKGLSKAEKKAIRSECAKACRGKDGKIDQAKYDAMCAERGVDNHR